MDMLQTTFTFNVATLSQEDTIILFNTLARYFYGANTNTIILKIPLVGEQMIPRDKAFMLFTCCASRLGLETVTNLTKNIIGSTAVTYVRPITIPVVHPTPVPVVHPTPVSVVQSKKPLLPRPITQPTVQPKQELRSILPSPPVKPISVDPTPTIDSMEEDAYIDLNLPETPTEDDSKRNTEPLKTDDNTKPKSVSDKNTIKRRTSYPTVTVADLLRANLLSVGDKIYYNCQYDEPIVTYVDARGYIGTDGTKTYSRSVSTWLTNSLHERGKQTRTTRSGWDAYVDKDGKPVKLNELRKQYLANFNQ